MITFNNIGYFGRLGNQMFQYAALVGIATKKGFEYGIPHKNASVKKVVNSVTGEEKLDLLDFFKNIKAKNVTEPNGKTIYYDRACKYEPGFFDVVEDGMDILGYFQSEKYFSHCEKEIRELMKRFAERAFRRPVSPSEIEPYVQLVLQQKIEPVVTMPGGIDSLNYRVYEGKWSQLPDFNQLKPVKEGKLPKGLIDIRIANRKDFYGIVFEGKIVAPQTGDYFFEMASDDIEIEAVSRINSAISRNMPYITLNNFEIIINK